MFRQCVNGMNMRILNVLPEFSLEAGGVNRAVLDIATALTKAKVQVTIACPKGKLDQRLNHCDSDAPRFYELGSERGFWNDLREASNQADLIHIHNPWWPTNVPIAVFARALGKPLVLTPHGMLDRWSLQQKRFKKKVALHLFARPVISTARLHCTAEFELEQVSHVTKFRDAQVVPLFVPSQWMQTSPQERARASPEPTRILFLSRVHPKKGLEIAIKTLGKLSNASLTIAGPCEKPYRKILDRLILQEGVQERVQWLGSVSGEIQRQVYQNHSVFILPTYQENFGLVLVEALNMGLKVFTTRGTDVWREIESCGGVICESHPESFATAISKFVREEGGLNSVHSIEEQRRSLKAWLDPDVLCDKYVSMYRKWSERS
jgi:glycosyltransferase involved in cell wall biosynthesis